MVSLLRQCKSVLLSYLRSKDGELVRALKGVLGYTPVDLSLYKTALTHSSLRNQKGARRMRPPLEHNERLEFLGDTIICTVVSEYLYRKFPEQREGFLTQLRSKIVARDSLCRLARALELPAFIKAHPKRPLPNNILGNTLEALMGAVYLDMGYARAKKIFLQRIFLPQVDVDELVKREFDYKSRLLEIVQRRGDKAHFETLEESRREEKKRGPFFFSSTLRINDEVVGSGSGTSKKEAEQCAARQAYTAFMERAKT